MRRKKYNTFLKKLNQAKNPLFFFDDDPDGLAAFLLCYRQVKRGHGIVVKSTPIVKAGMLKKIDEHNADAVFVLDLAKLDPGFVDGSKVPIAWVDHHEPAIFENVFYINPRLEDSEAYIPVSWIIYEALKSDLWIATVGTLGDFAIPSFIGEFKKQYPGYINNEKTPEELLFKTKLGNLVRVFSFILKGPTRQVMSCVKVLTRIQHPDEIMNKATSQGRFIYKYYEKYLKHYNELLQKALNSYRKDDTLLVFVYPSSKISMTADLALELIYRFPDKLVIVAREKNNEMKISIRSRGIKLTKLLDRALKGVNGYGGGHEYAVGANVKKQDFKKFIKQLRMNLEK